LCQRYPHDIIDKIRLLEAVMQQVAQGLASLGRGGDTQLVHMTPGEVHGLQALAMSHGGSLTINPHTGLPEANFLRSILPMALGAGAMLIPGAQGIGAGWLAAGFGGLSALASGSWKQGLSDGLGFFGGANLTNSLAGMGLSESQSGEVAKLVGPEAATSPQAMGDALRYDPMKEFRITGGLDEGLAAPDTRLGTTDFSAPKVAELARTSEAALNMAPTQAAARGLGQFVSEPVSAAKNLYGKVGASGIASMAAPFIPDMMNQPTLANSAALPSKGNIRPYQYTAGQVDPEAQKQIAQFGFSKVPYFTGQGYNAQPVYAAAAGGQVPQPSLPLDLSQNYPGSNITKSSYATLPSTQPQEIMDGYGPKINPFTGAEGMAEGGPVARLIEQMKINKQGPFADPREEAMKYAYSPEDQQYTQMAAGGIASLSEYAAGGKLLRGPGDGMSDDIPAVIKGETPQRAALADGEFVVPADVVSHLGNGSTDAGAKRLYTMMDRVRKARTGNPKQGKQITAERFMPA
jgi:hypothetical protein